MTSADPRIAEFPAPLLTTRLVQGTTLLQLWLERAFLSRETLCEERQLVVGSGPEEGPDRDGFKLGLDQPHRVVEVANRLTDRVRCRRPAGATRGRPSLTHGNVRACGKAEPVHRLE